MKQFSTVFQFELSNYVKKKSYIVTTIVLIAAVVVLLCVPLLMDAFSGGDGEGAATAPADLTKIAFKSDIPDAAAYYDDYFAENGFVFEPTDASQAELQQMVDEEQYSAAIIQTGPLAYTRIVKTLGMYDYFDEQFKAAVLDKYEHDTLAGLGVPADTLAELQTAEVTADIHTTESGTDQSQNFFYTYILIFVLYMAIVAYGQFVASSVATEKSSRAMELLITSADPKSLIFGKVLGTGTAGLLQFAVILGSAALVYNLNAPYYEGNMIVQSIFGMPISMVFYTILFFLLGFFMYAFLYAALGSLVSRMEDLSTTTQPITFMFVIAFLVVVFSMSSGNIDNPAMVVCSYIPFTSPMAMFTRIAMSDVPAWEIVLSVGILVVSTIAIGYLATGIYRLGVLMYGKPPKLKELGKLLRAQKQTAKHGKQT